MIIVFLSLFFLLVFWLVGNCFTILCWFLLYNKPIQFNSVLPQSPCQPSRSSQSVRLGSLCYLATFYYLFYTWSCIYDNATFSVIPPLLSLECWKSSITWFLMNWPQIKIIEVSSSLILPNKEPFLDWTVICDEKWILCNNQ